MEPGHTDPPTDQPIAPATVTRTNYYELNDKNRVLGYRLWFRRRVEGVPAVAAWRGVFPESTANDESAKRQCNRFLKWYEEEYPPTFDQVANALGLSPYRLMSEIKQMFDATLWEWDDELKTKVDTGRPDFKVRAMGIDRMVKLVSKSQQWRKQFLEQKDDSGTRMNLPPEHATVEEWEKWARENDLRGEIDRAREAATKERDRRLAAEGRKFPTPPFTNGENGKHQ